MPEGTISTADTGREGMMKGVFDVWVEGDEDGWLVASVAGLHGCHTQARSLEELVERVCEAVELCVEVPA
jgi:predicted RNase H-like HicB family nuclease